MTPRSPAPFGVACPVGPAEWDAFEATLVSLVLSSPRYAGRIFVLSDGAPPARVRRLGAIHPRLEFRDTALLARTRRWLPGGADQPERSSDGTAPALAAVTLRGIDRLLVVRPGVLFDADVHETVGALADGSAPGLVVLPGTMLSDGTERKLARAARAGSLAESAPARMLAALSLESTTQEGGDTEPRELLPGLADGSWSVPALWRRFVDRHGGDGELGDFYARQLRRLTQLSADETGNLPAAAGRRFSAGDFQTAVAIWREHARTQVELAAEHWLAFGSALKAVSRYDEAVAALTIAAEEPRVRASALAGLAQIRWITHDLDDARDLAGQALRWDPFERTARSVQWRVDNPLDAGQPPLDLPGARIGHVAFYVDPGGNFGDVLLPIAVRRSIETAVPDIEWRSIHAHQLFDVEQARAANETLDALVLGGGGLFLPDTMPNGNSGWQWNVTDAALEALRIPLIVYTVGYNLFPGQEFYGDRFAQSVTRLVQRASYVGLRNHGSINRVRGALPAELAEKVEYLPCATTVFGELPAAAGSPPAGGEEGVLINAAYDRSERRFGDVYARFLASMAEWVRHVDARDRIRVVAHAKEDERFAYDLRREHGLSVDVVPMHSMPWREALDVYRRSKLVVGMRGHATMIPFGVGAPVLSLISHPKMAYFLDDIRHPEWGVAVDDPELAGRLIAVTDRILDDEAEARGAVDRASRRLRGIVDAANARIAQAITEGGTRP